MFRQHTRNFTSECSLLRRKCMIEKVNDAHVQARVPVTDWRQDDTYTTTSRGQIAHRYFGDFHRYVIHILLCAIEKYMRSSKH